jgi:hypothetical protein
MYDEEFSLFFSFRHAYAHFHFHMSYCLPLCSSLRSLKWAERDDRLVELNFWITGTQKGSCSGDVCYDKLQGGKGSNGISFPIHIFNL